LTHRSVLAAPVHFCYLASAMPETPAAPFVIRFESISLAAAGGHAAALREALLDAATGVQASLERTSSDAMDLGSALRLDLQPKAVAPVARSLADYMARERPGIVVIQHQGRVVYRGDATDATRIEQALASRAGQGW
jgi:osmotically-inducible protein OsmY